MTRVIIVGAGIGGLALAAALRRERIEPVVLERAPRLDAAGAGISLAPNAIRALDALGLADEIRQRGAACRTVAILDRAGKALQELPTDVIAGGVAIHRAELQSALRSGEEQLGSEVRRVDRAGVVTLADGRQLEADLVVGADGARSATRRSLFPDREPVYAGYSAWRAVAPLETISGRWTESWGRGARFGMLDIGGGRTYWFATKNTPALETDGGRREILARFDGWHEPVPELVEATPAESILRNDVYHLAPLPRWSAGRVTLLGDAAHAATPGIGQGAAQALEDAVVLARALAAAATVDDALRVYESSRRPRTRTLAQLARRADRIAQARSPLLCAVRDKLTAATPQRIQRRQYETILNADL
jgi:2-polyprenyl-6-methoxyphenol hydroxylase-like FAD-dependent oxidoreductase